MEEPVRPFAFPAAALAFVFAAFPASAPVPAPVPDFGIISHHDGTLNEQVAWLMRQRGFKHARMDLMWERDPSALRDQASRIRANGGTVQVSLQVAYQWDHSCNRNLASLEQQAHDQAATLINAVKDVIHDFELLNEVQLRPEIQQEVTWNSAGTSAAPYKGKPCVAALTAALRGMSRAVADVRASSGLPLRSILGVVGRDFGYLSYMRQQGVQWDVTGFHVYPKADQRSLLADPWYGPGGPFAQLASFGKPVHVNELNCGEIYAPDFGSRASVEKCLRGLTRHLWAIRRQQVAHIEAVYFYELFDEPQKEAPENRFGLMQDLAHPKVLLFLASAFAGGALSAGERLELTSRGLLTDAEIDAFRVGPAATSRAEPGRPARD